jgi:hypothetical protein
MTVTVTYTSATDTSGYTFLPFTQDIAQATTIPGGTDTEYTATNIAAGGLYTSQTLKFRFIGTDFTYNGDEPESGTVTSIEIRDASDTLLVTLAGFDFEVADLVAAIAAFNDDPSDPAPLSICSMPLPMTRPARPAKTFSSAETRPTR